MINPLQGYLSVRDWKTRLIFWSGALAVGVVSALFALGSNWMIGMHARILENSRWWTLPLSPLVLMTVVYVTRRVFPGSQSSGIPQAIAALRTDDDKLRKRVLSLRIALGKVLMTLLGFLSGASIGREGPTIHIGASIMYSLGRFTNFPRHYVKHGLIMAGGAAGVAAAFNTPIAGIIFAIEEMARFYEERATGMILVAVIIAGIVALGFLGNYSYFGESSAHFDQLRDWVAVPMCGVIGGLLGGTFSQLLVSGVRRLRPLVARHGIMIAAVCGLIIAILGLLSHGLTYGTGYDQARHVLTGDDSVGFWFPFYKMLATLTSFLSGMPGGVFSPSLSAGAGLGADLAPMMPYISLSTVVLLGMVSYFTGVVQTPLTASVIVMEMVNSQSMAFPIMATAFIALAASKLVCRQPIYWALAEEFLGDEAQEPVAPSMPAQKSMVALNSKKRAGNK